MFIKSFELINYRNYPNLKLGFDKHLILLLGQNGAGKTNFLESIYYLSNGKSYKNVTITDLIKWGCDYALIRAIVEFEEKQNIIEVQLNSDGKVKMRFNKIFLKNRQSVYKKMPVVLFSPDDLKIIKSFPGFRRDFIDDILNKTSLDFYNLKLKYQKILNQRNSLLKSMDSLNKDTKKEVMEIWNENLISTGVRIIFERINLLKSLRKSFLRYMNYFFSNIEVDINYVFSWERSDLYESNEVPLGFSLVGLGKVSDIENKFYTNGINSIFITGSQDFYEVFRKSLDLNLKRDILTKNTSVGPHRDDIAITLDGRDIRYFGSQGQQRVASVCLKLAELEILKEKIEKKPILLLDDVLSELDIERKTLLLKLIKDNFQTFITTANFEYINDVELNECTKYFFENNEARLL